MAQRMAHKLNDERGASIVIALVFFLICAVIGSVVVTAATVNSKTTATYKQSTQEELTVTSAAKTLSSEMQRDVQITWDYSGPSPKPVFPNTVSSFVKKFWEDNGDAIWVKKDLGESFYAPTFELDLNGSDSDPVYAFIKVDRDFNITIDLSLSENQTDISPYREIATLQAIPTFDLSGKVTGISWAEPVITTANTGPSARSSTGGA